MLEAWSSSQFSVVPLRMLQTLRRMRPFCAPPSRREMGRPVSSRARRRPASADNYCPVQPCARVRAI